MDNAERLGSRNDMLTTAAFIWSEARLIIAAVALIVGGPPVLLFLPIAPIYGLLVLAVKLSWVVSGAASLYLLYRWHGAKWYVFDSASRKDVMLLAVSIVSGLNLGIAGIIQVNLGLSFFTGYLFSVIAAAVYVYAAYHLYQRWDACGRRLFY